MSEIDTDQEVEVAAVSIPDMIKAIEDGKFTDATAKFNSIVGDRLQDVLDQARIKLAGQIYNDEEPEEDTEEEPEDDEDFEDDDETEN